MPGPKQEIIDKMTNSNAPDFISFRNALEQLPESHPDIKKIRVEAIHNKVKGYNNPNRKFIRQNFIIYFTKPPAPVTRNGAIVGIEAYIRVFDKQGNELDVDPHRVIINPPTMVVSKGAPTTLPDGAKSIEHTYTFDPEEAFLTALEDSVTSHPNPRKR